MVAIVQVNVTQTLPPAPSTLQKTGAIISQGSTTTAAGTLSLLTQDSDLTPILTGAHNNSFLSWASSVVTVTTASPHGFTNGDTLSITISGAAPTGYNGTFLATITGASTFTYPMAINPGTATAQGAYTVADVAELNAKVNTFYSQGSNNSVYVLELGAGNAADGVAFLNTWIQNNLNTVYAYLVPKSWADEPTYRTTLIPQFESLSAKTYFFTTCSLSNYNNFTNLMKCCHLVLPAPTTPATEFTEAAFFYNWLNYSPSTTNQAGPFAFQYVYGVTPYPLPGNGPLLTGLSNPTARNNPNGAYVDVVDTGAEGGISNTMQKFGQFADGNDGLVWWAIDWLQINGHLDLANEAINGSNGQPPLYFDQNGINRLFGRLMSTTRRGVSYGLFNSSTQPTVTAVPYSTYVAANPSDYKIGRYSGLSVNATPSRGFKNIIFNMNINLFPTS